MSDTTDPWDPFIHIRARLSELAEPLGLKLVQGSFIPGETNIDQHHAHFLFEVDTEMLRDPEEVATDKAFEKMIADEKDAEVRAKQEQAKAEMEKMLAEGKGFLEDE